MFLHNRKVIRIYDKTKPRTFLKIRLSSNEQTLIPHASQKEQQQWYHYQRLSDTGLNCLLCIHFDELCVIQASLPVVCRKYYGSEILMQQLTWIYISINVGYFMQEITMRSTRLYEISSFATACAMFHCVSCTLAPKKFSE